MRLDKLISKTTALSRSEAGKAIRGGRVTVNGTQVVKADSSVDESSDSVTLDGKSLSFRRFNYYMLNKPAGVVSATEDRSERTVLDLFDPEARKGLFPVGRLDKDTTGLLFITDDGELGHHLTSPRHEVPKTYRVVSLKPLTDADVLSFSNGLDIGQGERSKPAKLQILSEQESYVTVTEGKFHEVKRMFKAVDNEVLELERISMGGIELDRELKQGEYRRLTDSEIEILHENT